MKPRVTALSLSSAAPSIFTTRPFSTVTSTAHESGQSRGQAVRTVEWPQVSGWRIGRLSQTTPNSQRSNPKGHSFERRGEKRANKLVGWTFTPLFEGFRWELGVRSWELGVVVEVYRPVISVPSPLRPCRGPWRSVLPIAFLRLQGASFFGARSRRRRADSGSDE